jgi:hypothetical protein
MDNFDLKKFLKENKSLENLNPTFKSLNENKSLKDEIREMILAELNSSNSEKIQTKYNEMFGKNPQTTFADVAKALNLPSEEVENVLRMNSTMFENELEEAKKKDEEVEDVETTDVETTDTTEDAPEDEAPTEEAPAAGGGGLEDIAADMEGNEGELMDSLMKAFKIAKGMNNEKLETQVGNTLKFFVSEYIGGGEQ